ncbi:DUF3566 domain-containing protein [Streptomyces albus]|uniref:DUF3566 domain-containing protein n=1 Tax=Streptomyces albus TaxID=1888 RepID=UPI0004C76A9D|nr:DUF3566 domain-containing protein [Streptomyces albus]
MSGATGAGAGGAGTEGRHMPPAATGTGGARGPAQADSYPAGTYQGGTAAVTDTRQPYPQPAEPYHPPQAYASPGEAGQPPVAVPPQAPGQPVRRPRTGAGARTVPRTRKARLRVAKADPWSVMKVGFLLSIALGICTIIAVAVLWMVLDAMGVFSTVGTTIGQATQSGEGGGGGFDLESFLSLPRVLMFTSVIAVIDVVLATALATLGAFVYNLSAGFVGGVELTLAEDE